MRPKEAHSVAGLIEAEAGCHRNIARVLLGRRSRAVTARGIAETPLAICAGRATALTRPKSEARATGSRRTVLPAEHLSGESRRPLRLTAAVWDSCQSLLARSSWRKGNRRSAQGFAKQSAPWALTRKLTITELQSGRRIKGTPEDRTKELQMRSLVIGTAAAASLGFLISTAWAAPTPGVRDVAPTQNLIEQVQYSRYCARLRRACEFKHERGEAGEGNCRRYRRECGFGYRDRRW